MHSLHQDAEELINGINQHVQGGDPGKKTLPGGSLHLGLISALNISLRFKAEGVKQPVRTQGFLRCVQAAV